VLRFLLSRRALLLLAALIVLAPAFTALAGWQWDRAHSRVVDPLSQPAVPIDEVSDSGTAAVPGNAVGRQVKALGTYAGQRTYVVTRQSAAGATLWSMTPLLLSDGSVVPVVHGQVASVTAGKGVVLPRGRVAITGRMQPSQAPGAIDAGDSSVPAADPSAGVLSAISTSEIVGLVDAEIRPGFVLASAEVPAVVGVEPIPTSELVLPSKGVRIQNVLYTVQWTLFSAFAFFVYWRLLRDAWRDYARENHSDALLLTEATNDRNPLKESSA